MSEETEYKAGQKIELTEEQKKIFAGLLDRVTGMEEGITCLSDQLAKARKGLWAAVFDTFPDLMGYECVVRKTLGLIGQAPDQVGNVDLFVTSRSPDEVMAERAEARRQARERLEKLEERARDSIRKADSTKPRSRPAGGKKGTKK